MYFGIFGSTTLGLYSMDSTNAQDQEQATRGEYHGQGSSLMRKLSLLFHLATLIALNGSISVFGFITEFLCEAVTIF